MKWSRLSLLCLSIAGLPACGAAAVQPPPARTVASVPASPRPQMAAGEGPEQAPPDGPITPAVRAETVERLAKALGESYVFPEKGARAQAALRARAKRGEYNAMVTGNALATALTAHMNEILQDVHFRVGFSVEDLPVRTAENKPTAGEIAHYEEISRQRNGGFEPVERLPGNIGYIEVRSFGMPGRGYDAAAAAMGFVAQTDALIIDIRRNGGGDPDMVAALCSYFFPEPVHLNDLYFRPENKTRQFWTSGVVPGTRYLGREIYVLTSRKTGSGAEEFAYNLQQLKRATLIGEVTWGGAHPGDRVRLSAHFSAFVPTGRAINPVSKTNWEGVGVKPDVAVAGDDALRVAQVMAVEKRVAATKDPEFRRALEERLKELGPR